MSPGRAALRRTHQQNESTPLLPRFRYSQLAADASDGRRPRRSEPEQLANARVREGRGSLHARSSGPARDAVSEDVFPASHRHDDRPRLRARRNVQRRMDGANTLCRRGAASWRGPPADRTRALSDSYGFSELAPGARAYALYFLPSVRHPPWPLHAFWPLHACLSDLQPPCPLQPFWPLQACLAPASMSS